MDNWYLDHEDLPSDLFNASRTSLGSSSCSSALGLTQDEETPTEYFLELGDPNPIQHHFYDQIHANMETELISHLFAKDFNQTNKHQSSSSSSMQSLSMSSPDQGSCLPPLSSDDMVITQAIAAVFSSASSSTSSSYSSPKLQLSIGNSDQPGAFRPYNSSFAPDFGPKKYVSGQKMAKRSFVVLRRIEQMREEGRTKELPRSNGIQAQHIVSERKRREKLNESFHTLRGLLPHGSKKDKASVLINTKKYLHTLKGHISELEEEHTMLERHLAADQAEDDIDRPTERVKVQSVQGVQSKTGLQQIELKISVRVGCDLIELALRILECLKGMRIENLMSFHANMHSDQVDLFLQATLILHIKASDWDEDWFKEAMSRAVDRVTTAP